MCDVFEKEDAREILKGKTILFLGDSILRNIYKDLIWLIQDGTFLDQSYMADKLEPTFAGDQLKFGSDRTDPSQMGTKCREERNYFDQEIDFEITFNFITRCFSETLEDYLEDYCREHNNVWPDVIMMNSCLWDTNWYGARGPEEYKERLEDLCKYFQEKVDEHTQVIFMTTPPINTDPRGGFMVKQLEFMAEHLPVLVMEANQKASSIFAQYDFDVLDMHYNMINQTQRRSTDGIHWNSDAVRYQTNSFLTHYCLSREIDLPGNISSVNGMLEETKRIAESAKEAEDNQRNNNCGSNQNINVESGPRRVLKAKRFREE